MARRKVNFLASRMASDRDPPVINSALQEALTAVTDVRLHARSGGRASAIPVDAVVQILGQSALSNLVANTTQCGQYALIVLRCLHGVSCAIHRPKGKGDLLE